MTHIETALDPLFQEVSDGICASDAEGNILYLNPAAERMLEARLSEVRGSSLCELLCGHLSKGGSKECASTCVLRDRNSGHDSVTFQGEHNRRIAFQWSDAGFQRQEKWRNLRVRCLRMPSPWFDPQKPNKRLTIIEDVSMEMELQRQREDWRHMVAHDLRAPLTTIFAALRIMQDDAAAKTPRPPQPLMIDASVRASQRMLELLELYLELAKLDAGLMPVHMERINLSELVGQRVEEQAALAQERRIKVSVTVPPMLVAQADRDLSARVLQNLLNNALKFTPEGGGVSIIAKQASEGTVALSVGDTGPGIESDDLPRIFDRYYQAKARREGKLKGTGLGLTFCREALKVMHGSIAVESRPGEGSLFTISLSAGT